MLKFTNHSPSLFATSSFDGDVKMWDLREGAKRPLFTRRSDQGNVMVCFSPDVSFVCIYVYVHGWVGGGTGGGMGGGWMGGCVCVCMTDACDDV